MAPEANTLQFELLDKSLSYPSESQREWWHQTGPLLARLMSSAGYTDQPQHRYLTFFYTSIVPFLGPHPQKFPSAMTHNELPLELSINFQQLGGTSPVIRVAVEPLTSLSGTKEDPYNLSPIRDFLDRLAELNSKGYDSRLFEHFYPKHTLDRSECQKLQAKNEKTPELSQVAFGFDLKPGDISVKGSVQEYLGDADRYDTLGLIKDYIDTTDARANFGFVYSHDCIAPEKSRHKMYGRTKDMSWDKVREIWTLGERIDSPESNRGLEYLERLWKLLHMGNTHPLGLHLVWNYETKAGLTVPVTKGSTSLFMAAMARPMCALSPNTSGKSDWMVMGMSMSKLYETISDRSSHMLGIIRLFGTDGGVFERVLSLFAGVSSIAIQIVCSTAYSVYDSALESAADDTLRNCQGPRMQSDVEEDGGCLLSDTSRGEASDQSQGEERIAI